MASSVWAGSGVEEMSSERSNFAEVRATPRISPSVAATDSANRLVHGGGCVEQEAMCDVGRDQRPA